jgi:hypothetical protein
MNTTLNHRRLNAAPHTTSLRPTDPAMTPKSPTEPP